MKKIACFFGLLALSAQLASAQDAAKDVVPTKEPKEVKKVPAPAPTGSTGRAVSGSPSASAPGPVVKSGSGPVESQVVRTNEEKKAQMSVSRPTSQVLGKHVTYGGYLTDLARTDRKRALFDLKAPIDPQKDTENLSFYPGTDQVQGVILFSIKF